MSDTNKVRYYWVYLPEIDEAGCVVEAASFEDAFQEGCDCLNPEEGVNVQVHELGESRSFVAGDKPSFRVAGYIRVSFAREVRASSAREAEEKVARMEMAEFDSCNLSEGATEVYTVIPVDDGGDDQASRELLDELDCQLGEDEDRLASDELRAERERLLNVLDLCGGRNVEVAEAIDEISRQLGESEQ